jgi:hypothetical protein
MLNRIDNQLQHLYNMLNRYAVYGYILLAMVLLLPVWINTYFVTLDGPCHLYNANILRNMVLGQNTDFFGRFYAFNQDYVPNWFSHIVLAGLLNFCSPPIAEKLLITGYIIAFTGFSWLLANQINNNNRLLAFVALPFVYTYVLQKGFYNFSFGLVFMLLLLWFHFTYQNRLRVWMFVCIETLLFTITYFVHPFGYLLAGGILFMYTFLASFINRQPWGLWLSAVFKKLVPLTIAVLPSAVMMLLFFLSRTAEPARPNPETQDKLWEFLYQVTAIVNLTSAEEPYTEFVFRLFTFLLGTGLVVKLLRRRFSPYDSFLFMAAATLWFYFKAPASFAGGGMINQRLMLIPFIIIIFWFVSVDLPKLISMLASFAAIVVTIGLLTVRMPVHAKASDLTEDYLSAATYIKPYSTVLPLSYNHYGTERQGRNITSSIWIFFHSLDYMGSSRPLIMLGNYEAATNHFPLVWKPNKDPFIHLGKNEGIESTPPCVNFDQYRQASAEKVDYVLLLCYPGQYMNHYCTIDVQDKLNKDYTVVYTSPSSRTRLYELKR